jgi:putative beta-lysine N-acetyltransferase
MDTLQKFGDSLVQHGPHSDRVYLMKVAETDMPGLLGQVQELAAERSYTKLFAKSPGRYLSIFQDYGYTVEARVPGFFRGEEDGLFLARFLSEDRRLMNNGNSHLHNLALAEEKQGRGIPAGAELPGSLEQAGPDDCREMSLLYAEVFMTYPFPIHDPEYLRQTMAENIHYYCVRQEGKIVALASAETDPAEGNVEMTDFATSPSALGRGYALFLLDRMEQDMRKLGFRTSYTIARSESAGMNITFAKLGYGHAGTLVNNTNISGQIESMNVWYKPL